MLMSIHGSIHSTAVQFIQLSYVHEHKPNLSYTCFLIHPPVILIRNEQSTVFPIYWPPEDTNFDGLNHQIFHDEYLDLQSRHYHHSQYSETIRRHQWV